MSQKSNLVPIYLLPRGGQPRVYDTIEQPENVTTFRHIDCPGYHCCLDFASAMKWDGFHCLQCPIFEQHSQYLKEKALGLNLSISVISK